MLYTSQFADEVCRDETEAELNNISAVPFFVVNGKYTVPGALSVVRMEKGLYGKWRKRPA